MLRRLCLCHRHILLGRNVMQHAAYSTSIKRNYGDGSGNSQYDLTTYKLPFTPDEQNYLLATVNTITSADLARLKVTKRIIKQLMKSKAEVGSYAELSELLYINGFGIKAVESLCNALLRDRDGEEVEDDATNIMLHKNFRKRLVKPRVDVAQLEDVRTVVSVHVTAGCLAWAKIDRGSQVEDLSVEELLNSESRFDAPKIYDKVMDVASRIPDADLYVWEEKNNQQLIKVPLGTIIIAMQLAQIKGMLMVLLESRLKRDIMREEEEVEGAVKWSSGRLIYMKESIVPKLFMLKRGGERTSGLKLADELMSGQQLLSWLPPLDVGEGVQDCYFSTHPSLRRHSATALFIGLAFNHAIIQQNVDVLRKLITPSV